MLRTAYTFVEPLEYKIAVDLIGVRPSDWNDESQENTASVVKTFKQMPKSREISVE